MFDSDFKLGRILVHLMSVAIVQDSSSLFKALSSAIMNPKPPSLFSINAERRAWERGYKNLPEKDARAVTECHCLSVTTCTSFSLIPRSHNTPMWPGYEATTSYKYIW